MDWEEKFAAGDEYLFGTEPSGFLVAEAHRMHPGMKALAVADGEGRNGVWLAGRGLDVLSVDGSASALKKAERLARERCVNLKTACVDLLHWDWPKSQFDLVVVIFFHVQPADRLRVHHAMSDALKPGGMLLLESFHPDQVGRGTGGPPDALRMHSAAMLKEDFAGMEILSLREEEVTMHMTHDEHRPGLAAVTRLVAKKI